MSVCVTPGSSSPCHLVTLSPCHPKGRLAPSPTGAQHVGNARTYLIAWLSARARGGRAVLRTEDLDSPRADGSGPADRGRRFRRVEVGGYAGVPAGGGGGRCRPGGDRGGARRRPGAVHAPAAAAVPGAGPGAAAVRSRAAGGRPRRPPP